MRILGEITPERVALLQRADAIFMDEIREAGLYRQIAQALTVLLPVRSVGVMGDQRTYENVLALRAVTTEDFMTADWFRFPPEVLDRVARRIVNEVRGHQPGGVRRDVEAPRHDRVGVDRDRGSGTRGSGCAFSEPRDPGP